MTLLSSGSNTYSQLSRVIQDLGMLPVNMKFPFYFNCIKTLPFFGHKSNCKVGRHKRYHGHCVVGKEPEFSTRRMAQRTSHSVAVTSKREVWVWGSGRNGRLGLRSSIGEDEPNLVEYLEGFEVLQAVSGFDHNLVLVFE
ncbi:Serine/threonine-protein kinase Nek8 [Camellia lanceoleosa]|uniref:Serine/threonine-protein kinase Nek8 n=1 Tax=Camellia lanceoleosa TaxID=1840588 RepID=A0ACC0ID76_9ERIC|nr:Serine/threonine-protein kinase Nek8 [Camellia lanceoleosa]